MLLPRKSSRAFTLIELIMVMVIIAIVTGTVVPSLRGFTMGRKTNNIARQVLALAQYAHTQAISEGREYRLNVDSSQRKFWLTADHEDGSFQAPGNEFGTPITCDATIKIELQATPPVIPLYVSESGGTVAMPSTGNNSGVQNYVSFQPGGRTDVATITVTDNFGSKYQIACSTPTELFRIVPAGELP